MLPLLQSILPTVSVSVPTNVGVPIATLHLNERPPWDRNTPVGLSDATTPMSGQCTGQGSVGPQPVNERKKRQELPRFSLLSTVLLFTNG